MDISTFKPINRHVQIIPFFEKSKKPTEVLLPEDYSPDQEKYVVARVVAVSSDCCSQVRRSHAENQYGSGLRAIVDRSMIEKVETPDKTFYIILENYIIGLLCSPGDLD